MKKKYFRIRKFFTKRILHADDTSHALGLGAACGVFASILPAIGLQTAIAVGMAAVLRANKLIGIPLVWLSNPFTAPLLIYLCFKIGQVVWPNTSTAEGDDVVAQFLAVCRSAELTELTFWKNLFLTLGGFGVELWIGSTLVGALLAVPTYFVTRWMVDSHRLHHKARVRRRHEFRARLRAQRVAAGQPA